MLKLYHNDMSVCAQKVRLVLAYKELDWTSEHLNLRSGDQFKPEFQAVNPKGVVPVLQHNRAIVTESNAIIEYLEEVFPRLSLMPANALCRAQVRQWMIRLDAGLHESIAVISFCSAFRHQLLERYDSTEELETFIANIKDPARAAFMRDVLPNGMKSQRLALAVYAYDCLLKDMETALEGGDWLVGRQLTLADYCMLPYVERLQQLHMEAWWQDKPNVAAWLQRIQNTPAYRKGMREWHNTNYIELLADKGRQSWPGIKAVVDHGRF
ncbi:glutathione S-transferase family protein [Pseudomaricurvus alkylphenolicus]|uniref:glutathione S-transferase family protein n=1 Tax=Pseudomaricurvus alkylphenolicus TaxID=1306991 RepID=UPI00141E0A99|nr:glutathione S-transferase family protein [Pseudomaricurvus alkylphenolicus]NIB43429.1 glutathione S-transferase family protein [Pseudomaricurvus alkylphenolicus]